MHKGQLKNWNDAKGFGFISSSELSSDTFVHISSLKSMSRKPKAGDTIYFELHKQADGKSRAIRCRIEGVPMKARRKSHRPYNKKPASMSRMVSLVAVIVVCLFIYKRIDVNSQVIPSQHPTPSNVMVNDYIDTQFECDGRQYCSQMTSRAEAEFFIKHCPNTKMDGDHDGFPCENDTRF